MNDHSSVSHDYSSNFRQVCGAAVLVRHSKIACSMSELGRNRAYACISAISAKPSPTDSCRISLHVRSVP